MHYNAHLGLWIFTYFVQYTKDLLTFKPKYTIAMQQKLSQKLIKESKKVIKKKEEKEETIKLVNALVITVTHIKDRKIII